MTQEKITVSARIEAPLAKVWEYYNDPVHVMKWNNASEDWHTPRAENDVRKGGRFNYRMEARDGSMGFDFSGTYTEVVPNERIVYTIDDGRNVEVTFHEEEQDTVIEVIFEAEKVNSLEKQREGWQSILDNFMRYVESTE